jgi:hypothetical protein
VMKLVSFQWFIMFKWLIVVNVIQWLVMKLVIRHTLFSRRCGITRLPWASLPLLTGLDLFLHHRPV